MTHVRTRVAPLRLLDPVAELARKPGELAPRVKDLNNRVLVFFDNLPTGAGGGDKVMNTFYQELRALLDERFQLADVRWTVKPERNAPAPKLLIEEVVTGGADVVVNGSCT